MDTKVRRYGILAEFLSSVDPFFHRHCRNIPLNSANIEIWNFVEFRGISKMSVIYGIRVFPVVQDVPPFVYLSISTSTNLSTPEPIPSSIPPSRYMCIPSALLYSTLPSLCRSPRPLLCPSLIPPPPRLYSSLPLALTHSFSPSLSLSSALSLSLSLPLSLSKSLCLSVPLSLPLSLSQSLPLSSLNPFFCPSLFILLSIPPFVLS
jgi:hypothetical protein